ncbi:hypothetical protein [Vibrio nereis]|uniref:Uncharacterized protein n=1 Tax=Vibrio nereis TaxID=693 RepID=A0A0M0HRW9_VIBNE|nr:hypothetical protein [Vibrio nereis]KOO04811.1 hypothetical protein AKJ17_03860 [Vibrio nereis]
MNIDETPFFFNQKIRTKVKKHLDEDARYLNISMDAEWLEQSIEWELYERICQWRLEKTNIERGNEEVVSQIAAHIAYNIVVAYRSRM